MDKHKWGVWNGVTKRFCFGIRARDKAEAYRQFQARAPKKLQYRWRYEVKPIPRDWVNPPNPNWKYTKGVRRACEKMY